ncbi:MAG: DUF2254 domain-containing protein [Mycobacteriales bacterium]
MTSGLSNRVNVLRDALQARLWPVPTVGLLLAVALGVLIPYVDTRVDGSVPPTLRAYLFGGGADAARTVLSAIGGSLITVTSLTFSLTVVTLQLASSQFSPRLLRTFSRDPVVHRTLALFLGTFAYSLVVLRTVRTTTDSGPEFVPRISITVAVALTLASVFVLVLFLDHLATQIRVETMLDDVHADAADTVRRVLQKRPHPLDARPLPPQAPHDACPIEVAESGFLVGLDEDGLLAAACAAGAVVRIEGFPGSSLVRGTPFGRSWPLGDAPVHLERQCALSAQVAAAVRAGRERTGAQDISFGLRQLTDVAIKALSPGINDPTTAVHALGHISGLLCEMVDYQLGPKLLHDELGQVRVVLERPALADLLDSALAQPRRYAAAAPSVLARITLVLREVAWRARDPEAQQAVRDELLRLRETVAQADLGSAETAELARLDALVEQALNGRW